MDTKRLDMMAQGNMTKTLLILCLPPVLAMTINGIYNIVDTFFVGMLDITEALGALAVIFPVFILLSALGIGIEIGAGSFISRSLGERNLEKAQKALSTTLILSISAGFLLGITGILFIEPLLRFIGATDVVLPYAKAYSTWFLASSPFLIANIGMAGTIRAEGNSIFPTIALTAGAVLNIALDPLFIFVFKMGIRGAAIATSLSIFTTFIIQISYYLSKKSLLRITLRLSSFNFSNIKYILKIGIPVMLKQLLVALFFTIMNMLLVPYGETILVGMGIVAKISLFVMMLLMGFSQGLLPVVSFNIGAGNYKRIMSAIVRAFFIESIFTFLWIAVCLFFGKEIIGIFSKDPAVLQSGNIILIATAMSTLPESIQGLIETIFFSAGKVKAAFIMSISRQGLIFWLAAYIAFKYLGLNGIIWSAAAANIFSCIFISVPLYVSIIRKIKDSMMDLKSQSFA
jgi:putative MATE family efflux protein